MAKDSEVHQYLQRKKPGRYIVAPRNAILRIFFEIFAGWYFLKKFEIDIVYSYFGYAWFPKRWPQVSGSATSNLYFPEIDFWNDHHWLDRLKLRLIDFYRLCGVKRANAVVFETELLAERGRRIFGLKQYKTIKPSISIINNKQNFTLPPHGGSKGVKRGLFLCGWQHNKQIMLIPSIADEMRKSQQNFVFILTAPLDDSDTHKQFCELVRQYKVQDLVLVVGPVKKNSLHSLYSQMDFVFLLSKLESFSNNIIEAWHFRKVLIVADEPWSRNICQDAAVYVNRDSKIDIVEKLCVLINSQNYYQKIINCGTEMLLRYPTIQQRIKQEMEYIKYVKQQS